MVTVHLALRRSSHQQMLRSDVCVCTKLVPSMSVRTQTVNRHKRKSVSESMSTLMSVNYVAPTSIDKICILGK